MKATWITGTVLAAVLLSAGSASATDWRHTKTLKKDWRHVKVVAHTAPHNLAKVKADAHKKFVWEH